MTDHLAGEARKELLNVVLYSASAGSATALMVMAAFGQEAPLWLRVVLLLASLPVVAFLGLCVLDGWMTVVKNFRTYRDLREKERLEAVRKVMES